MTDDDDEDSKAAGVNSSGNMMAGDVGSEHSSADEDEAEEPADSEADDDEVVMSDNCSDSLFLFTVSWLGRERLSMSTTLEAESDGESVSKKKRCNKLVVCKIYNFFKVFLSDCSEKWSTPNLTFHVLNHSQ